MNSMNMQFQLYVIFVHVFRVVILEVWVFTFGTTFVTSLYIMTPLIQSVVILWDIYGKTR